MEDPLDISCIENAPMKHSVEDHLRLRADEYDRVIRTFIPGYDTMLATLVHWLSTVIRKDGIVIDLGGGTGSLAYAIAERFPGVQIEVRDVDPKMLEVADRRLSKYKHRVRLLEKSFDESLPKSDAIVASLSLHHVKDLQKKTELYERIFEALRKPGIFLNGDATMNPEKPAERFYYRSWREFMERNGMTGEEVRQHFRDWADEDRYFSILEELTALASAGFRQPDCFWKSGAFAVFGGLK